jgi:hypothetical protein
MRALTPAMVRALKRAENDQLSGMIGNRTIRGLLQRGHIESIKADGAERTRLTIKWKITTSGRNSLVAIHGRRADSAESNLDAPAA